MVAVTPLPTSMPGAARPGHGRAAFTLVELMVSITIIVILLGMISGAAAAARAGQRRFKAGADIAKLDAVIRQHYTWCQSLRLPGTGSRADLVTRRISGDMPDNWTDVATLATAARDPATRANLSAPQRTYAGIWRSLQNATPPRPPSADFADAECLYMIVTRGGLADCLKCSDLDGIDTGDTDGDGAAEFLDPWGNPIRFVLWPQAFELPPGTLYFSDGRTRPLIFSAGPDGKGTIAVNDGGNLPTRATGLGGFSAAGGSSADCRADNITNFDAESKQ